MAEKKYDVASLIESKNIGGAAKKALDKLIADGGSQHNATMIVQFVGGGCVGTATAPRGEQSLTDPVTNALRALNADGFSEDDYNATCTVTFLDGGRIASAAIEDEFGIEKYRQ